MAYGAGLALGAAADYLLDLGIERILEHDLRLGARLIDGLEALGAVIQTPREPDRRAGIVNARFPQFPALIDHVPSLQSPWLGLFGSADQSIPVEDVERLRDELVGAPVDTEVVLYEGAEHGFHCDARESYHAEAAKDGWQRTLEWFAEHLK